MPRRIIAALSLAAMLLASCSGQAETAREGGGGAATERVGGSDSRHVAFIPPAFTSPFHVAVRDGAQAVVDEVGWQLDVVAAEQESDFARQLSLMEEEIQKGVDAIAVTPIDAKAIVAGVETANAAGTPVFMPNLITPVDSGDVVEYIGYDQWGGAEALGAYACDVLGGEGSVFILTGIPGFHANRRTGGFRAGLENNCPEVQVVGEQTAEWEREKAVNVASQALQQNPDIDLFYGNSDEMAIGACIAAQNQGFTVNEDLYCLGIDGNEVTLDLIDEGKVTATLGVYPTKIGETTIAQMAKYLAGEDIPEILETPSTVIDADNLDAYRAGETWTEPVEGAPEIDDGQPTAGR